MDVRMETVVVMILGKTEREAPMRANEMELLFSHHSVTYRSKL